MLLTNLKDMEASRKKMRDGSSKQIVLIVQAKQENKINWVLSITPMPKIEVTSTKIIPAE